jgi:uncharacterized protein YciI
MLFSIYCVDKPGHLPLRLQHYAAHREHCATGLRIVMSGPLVEDDGETMIGSLFVVEAKDRAEVEAYVARDPFKKAGLWESCAIRAFSKRIG